MIASTSFLPGGIVCIVMRQEYLDYVAEYKGRLLPMLETLVSRGWVSWEEQSVVPCYSFGKNGMVFVLKLFKSGTLHQEIDLTNFT